MTDKAVFLKGSPLRHILVMTGAASIGTMSMFAVDLADIWFLSRLGDPDITDGVGFGGAILFFTASISIGVMIAMGALVSRSLGARRYDRARRFATNVYAYAIFLVTLVAVPVWLFIPELLALIGASGNNLAEGASYLRIVIPSMPVFALAIASGGLVRAYGDARMSMLIMVSGAIVNAVLDPIFIFGLDMGIEGAAWASVIARLTVLSLATYVALVKHQAVAPFCWRVFRSHVKAITSIAAPAILTNVATPIGAAYTTWAMSDFGAGAVGGFNITVRLAHVVFAVMFSLSGAVGPIIGQNVGAAQFDRVRQVFVEALKFMVLYVLVAAAILFALQEPLIRSFRAVGVTADLILLFCNGLALAFVFSGCIFVANAGFNNLGRPHYSTLFNFGRATLGTIPFVHLGALYWGAPGVMIGQAAGGVLFGILAYTAAFWHVRRISRGDVRLGMVRARTGAT